MLPVYLKNSDVIVLVFDVTRKQSLQDLSPFINAGKTHAPNARYLLLGNKTDLTTREVSETDITEFAKLHGIQSNGVASYLETSAKENTDWKGLGDAITQLNSLFRRRCATHQNEESLKKIELFQNSSPENRTVQALSELLNSGVKCYNPSEYFTKNFDAMKSCVRKLQLTSKSLANTAVNVIITVLLALSGVGLPLAYFSGWLEKNKQASGHSLMFMNFGEKQAAQTLCHHVFEELRVRPKH